MSWQAVKAAYAVEGLDKAARAVLVALAWRAGADGRAWPSIARLVTDTGLSDRTVRRALRRLADAGRLRVIHNNGTPSAYTLTAVMVTGGTAVMVTGTAVMVTGHRGHGDRENSLRTEQEQATAGLTPAGPAVANGANLPGDPQAWTPTRAPVAWDVLADGRVRRRP